MLYLINGTSRAGKTIIEQSVIPNLSLDYLIIGCANGIPKYGIYHMQMPDDIARRIWSSLCAMYEGMIQLEA